MLFITYALHPNVMRPNIVCEDKIQTEVPPLLAVGLKTHNLSKCYIFYLHFHKNITCYTLVYSGSEQFFLSPVQLLVTGL